MGTDFPILKQQHFKIASMEIDWVTPKAPIIERSTRSNIPDAGLRNPGAHQALNIFPSRYMVLLYLSLGVSCCIPRFSNSGNLKIDLWETSRNFSGTFQQVKTKTYYVSTCFYIYYGHRGNPGTQIPGRMKFNIIHLHFDPGNVTFLDLKMMLGKRSFQIKPSFNNTNKYAQI